MSRQSSLYFIVIGAFLLFISGSFLSEGISRTGLDNAVISQRMATGFDDFWLPSLDTPGNPNRQNYLPLGYWIESKWFQVFGESSMRAEKFYSVLTYFLIAALMIWIWRLVGFGRHTGWLPLLFWIMIPLVSWSATNNLLESTMTIFVLLSVICMLKGRNTSFLARSRQAAGKKTGLFRIKRTILSVLAGLMMELAFMVKGVMGLFPIFLPFIYWLIVRREKPLYFILTTSVILLTWLVTLMFVVMFSPQVYDHLYNYLHYQLIGGILHVHTVASRFFIIYVLIIQMAIPLTIYAILCLIRIKTKPFSRMMFYKRHADKMTAEQINNAIMGWVFLILSLAGILPIMLGHKQQEFYLVPILPFMALSLACFTYNLIEDWLEKIDVVASRVLIAIAVVLFGSGLLLNINSIHRINSNKALLNDMRLILPYLDNGSTISVSPEIMNSPEVAEYFYRYKEITFDTAMDHEYMLSQYTLTKSMLQGDNYSDLKIPTSQYKLYQRVSKTTEEVTIDEQDLIPEPDSADTNAIPIN